MPSSESPQPRPEQPTRAPREAREPRTTPLPTVTPSASAPQQSLQAMSAPIEDHLPGLAGASFLMSFVYAWHGILYAVRTQRNMRAHVAIALCAIILGVVLRISPVEFAMIFVAITLVFIAEMFNTVAEACIDLVTSHYHPLARIAKDVAAGAVLLNAMLSVVIGLLVFGPHLLALAIHWWPYLTHHVKL